MVFGNFTRAGLERDSWLPKPSLDRFGLLHGPGMLGPRPSCQRSSKSVLTVVSSRNSGAASCFWGQPKQSIPAQPAVPAISKCPQRVLRLRRTLGAGDECTLISKPGLSCGRRQNNYILGHWRPICDLIHFAVQEAPCPHTTAVLLAPHLTLHARYHALSDG